MVKLTFWMNIPSFYQADLFRALVKTGEVDLHVIFLENIPPDRLKLGWENDLEGYDHEFLSDAHPMIDVIKKAIKYRDRVHIVGGLWAGRIIEAILITLLLSGSKFFIYSEAPDPRKKVSPIKNKILVGIGRLIVRKSAGILPISHFAITYFRMYGADSDKLHPFGYFRSMPTSPAPSSIRQESTINVSFVGQLIHRKGVDILLDAIESLFSAHPNLRLQFIGSGEYEEQLQEWTMEKKLTELVAIEPAINSNKIIERISEADVLVLPSRWDGWGLVVNEALMAGTPVIVSDMCGAADLIVESVNGYIFRSENIGELKRKLELFLGKLSSGKFMREEAQRTGSKLDATNAADYLLNCIQENNQSNTIGSNYPWLTMHQL